MKVEVNGKTYCVETLIADNERLRQDVNASADTIRLILDKIRAEIEQVAEQEKLHDKKWALGLKYAVKIIDKYKAERSE